MTTSSNADRQFGSLLAARPAHAKLPGALAHTPAPLPMQGCFHAVREAHRSHRGARDSTRPGPERQGQKAGPGVGARASVITPAALPELAGS